MKIVFRLLVALSAGALVYLGAQQSGLGMEMSGVTAGIAVLLIGVVLFLDRIPLRVDGQSLLLGSLGLLAGLVAGYFLRQLVQAAGFTHPGIVPVFYIVPGVFFATVASRYGSLAGIRAPGSPAAPGKENGSVREKILDTSVIIDGRILDIVETNFIDGPFVIPNFVLREIQLISDSPDPIKRNRGRRGLDMLNKLQNNSNVKVKITYADYTETREVDAKLVKLARETGAKLITNDFNLNKVAELQGVEVLNLNNLTNALKPVVLPNEDIVIDIIKEGKDENQGIGYLEDGTMVVVENGGSLVGKSTRVNVTSIIQTAAGKMIFTRAGGSSEEGEDRDDRNRGRGGRDRGRDRGGRDQGRGDRGGRDNRDQQPRDQQPRDQQPRDPAVRPEPGNERDRNENGNRFGGEQDRDFARGQQRRR